MQVTETLSEGLKHEFRVVVPAAELDAKLKGIMQAIHQNAYETSKEYGRGGDYVMGANVAGFVKVADAMLAHGLV